MHPGVLAKVCWDLSHHARSQRVTLQRMITAAVVVFIVTAGAESYWEIQSVKFSCSVVSYSLRPHGLQHTRLPCPSPTPRAYSNSCPLNRGCHPTISSSVILFSSSLQSSPALGSFPMSQFFASGVLSLRGILGTYCILISPPSYEANRIFNPILLMEKLRL